MIVFSHPHTVDVKIPGVGVEEIMVIINHVTEGAINDHVIRGSVCHEV